jgi:hypothetical protein
VKPERPAIANPDSRISLGDVSELPLLERFARSYQGITTGDNPRYIQVFWEQVKWRKAWKSFQSTGDKTSFFDGRQQIFLWEDGLGSLANSNAARIQGQSAWNSIGVAVRQMSDLPITLNTGSPWDMNSATLIPIEPDHLAAICGLLLLISRIQRSCAGNRSSA